MTGEGMTSPRSWLVFTHAPGCDIMISHSSGTWETRPASGVPPITFTTEAPRGAVWVVRLGQAQLHALFRREKCGDGGGACRLENNVFCFFGWTWACKGNSGGLYWHCKWFRLGQQGISWRRWWFQYWFFAEEKGSRFCHSYVCQEDSGVTTAGGHVYWKVWRWFMNQTFWIFLDSGSIFLDEFARVYTSNFSPLESLNHL